ncbi:MAG TPA: manganese catalase family protein [Candidatus Anaerotruncus excrementipullorum]|uniref:Manganese catalase family protein n=1 Tax=Candidatus Anaerotruncus excrementipullorum TaxID=2838465 RepID=A0A9D1WQ62_9FIRM|nr:manganese catalase family protein [Candidatus Anaerotruncus excrementipullorum]
MWSYEKKLQYPVKIKNPNPALAKVIISQLGGPDGELGAATRYLQQRYSMPYAQVKGMLTDIGTEELAHIEMVSAILYQLTRNLTPQQIQQSGFDAYFIDHTAGVYPQAASGMPFSTATLQVTGDTLADLYEDLAAEQKARLTYDNILRLVDDPDVKDPIRFLREREIVHFQRFGDALRIAQENLDAKNFYAFNPSFDKQCNPKNTVFSPSCVARGQRRSSGQQAAATGSAQATGAVQGAQTGAAGRNIAPSCGANQAQKTR